MKQIYEDLDRARRHARRTVKEKRQRIETHKETIETLLTQLIDDEALVEQYDELIAKMETEHPELVDDPFKEEK